MASYDVTVGAGSMRDARAGAVCFPHRWTPGGVTVEAEFTGAHLLHLATAGCVLNDVYREAESLGITVDGVRVRAAGEYDTEVWWSTGIEYRVEIDADVPERDLIDLLARVDTVAEIPRAIRHGAPVRRLDYT